MRGIDEADVPQQPCECALRIESVDAVVFRCHIDNVVVAQAGDVDVRNVERLGVDLTVDGTRKQLAELFGVDVGRGSAWFRSGSGRCGRCRCAKSARWRVSEGARGVGWRSRSQARRLPRWKAAKTPSDGSSSPPGKSSFPKSHLTISVAPRSRLEYSALEATEVAICQMASPFAL